MLITAIKTPIVTPQTQLFPFLDEYLHSVQNGSVIAITSKIVSIIQGRIVRIEETERLKETKGTNETNGTEETKEAVKSMEQKDTLIAQESEYYLPRSENPYNVSFAIKHNILAPSAGIDESNGNGYYILWPDKLQETTNSIREYLLNRFQIRHVGVIITDSKTSPMRWGVTGIALSHSGFLAVNDYTGQSDIFGRAFEYEKVNMMDSLAASAVVTMGEGAEMRPLAVISDVPFVHFQERNPTDDELKELTITKEIDLYKPLLKSVPWKKGQASS